jgi:hypothetical protein
MARSNIQAVAFVGDGWTVQEGFDWLARHGLTPIKSPRREGHSLRFRIRDPHEFGEEGHFITKKITSCRLCQQEGHESVNLVIGYYEGPQEQEYLAEHQ